MKKNLIRFITFCILLACLSIVKGEAQVSGQSQDEPSLQTLLELFEQYRVDGLERRDFSPDQYWSVLGAIVDQPEGLSRELVGHSSMDRPLYLVSYGEGPIEVMLWSQMHGDESTATMALADIFHFLTAAPNHPLAKRIAEKLTILAVPMLNPDGAEHFRRRNAQSIDINRDAVRLSTPEARTLKSLQERFHPKFGFNLHDQNPRTRVGESQRMAAIALLAPSFNEAQDDNAVRMRAKHLSATIRQAIEPLVGGHITRYNANFNPRAFGDNMQKWGVSTVLIESGGWKGDPEKQYLRKVNFVALLTAFDAIATGSYKTADITAYTGLPLNGSSGYDLLITGGTIVAPGLPPYRADLVLNYGNIVTQTEARVRDVGHLVDVTSAKDTLDVSGLFIHLKPSVQNPPVDEPKVWIGMPAQFIIRKGADPSSRIVWVMDGGVPYRPKAYRQ